jgi:phage gpG-like protein
MPALSFGNTIANAVRRMEALKNRASNLTPVMDSWSKYMIKTSEPNTFATAGHGTWAPTFRYGASAPPLLDTKKLLRGITRAFGPNEAIISTGPNSVEAHLMHFGGTVRAFGKFMKYGGPWMAIPVWPALSASQIRMLASGELTWGSFFAAGAFVLVDPKKTWGSPGYRGPGIYQRKGGKGSDGRVVRIGRFEKSVTHPPRPFMKIWPEDREYARTTGGLYVMTGKVK